MMNDLATSLRSIAASDFGGDGDTVFAGAQRIDVLEASVASALDLHRAIPLEFEEYSVCASCMTQTWPCATVLALSEATARVSSDG